MTTAFPSLSDHLDVWARENELHGCVAKTVAALAGAAREIARLVALGPLIGIDGHGQSLRTLHAAAHGLLLDAAGSASVAYVGCEHEPDVAHLRTGAPLALYADALENAENLDADIPAGTIFSILPALTDAAPQPGTNQIAAGYVIYGPQTALVLTLGRGTDIFWLDPTSGEFLLGRPQVRIPADTCEYAINTSNFRHWDTPLQNYVADCRAGSEGPRCMDFNMRWTASLVADSFRILTRGGVCIYPGDARPGRQEGRLRLMYQANPIAMLTEQAGGAATTGTDRILDIEPRSADQRVPLFFGSQREVDEIRHYMTVPQSIGERSPLFGQRGLFRN